MKGQTHKRTTIFKSFIKIECFMMFQTQMIVSMCYKHTFLCRNIALLCEENTSLKNKFSKI
jgi:hypothetical protein